MKSVFAHTAWRLCCVGVAVVSVMLPAQAQNLSQELAAEAPSKLVLEARERGDIVRGAILFHQGNIACAKCHRPSEESDRIGPDLSRIADDVTDESIVESILLPSKTIKDPFKSVRILDADGKVFSGIVVQQNEAKLVLRDSKDVQKLFTIQRQEIESMVDVATSIMPAELANELKGRQQFLDLLRYTLELREQGPIETAHQSVVSRKLSPETKGFALLRQHNCYSCHSASETMPANLKSSGPNLRWSAKHLNPVHLAKFIANPTSVKPGGRMPDLLHGFSESERDRVAKAIVNYLVSLDGSEYIANSGDRVDAQAINRGNELFHSVGCVACHAPRDSSAVEQPLDASIPLGKLSGKYSRVALTQFLETPHVARPSGLMPSMQLTHREAVDLACFLTQNSSQSGSAEETAWSLKADQVALGKQYFAELLCANCHTGVTEATANPPTLAFGEPESIRMRGCLAEQTQKGIPHFSLSEKAREDLFAALQSDAKLTTEQHIDASMTALNCLACHSRNNLGGVTEERSQYFKTSNLNLGEQGRIPPTLTGAGAKLKPKWMRDVLVNGRNIRPYMYTRMPQFGEGNVSHIIQMMQDTDQLAETEFAEFTNQKEMRDQGHNLVGNKGLNCVACHTFQYKISDTMPAVDLTEMSERLKKAWFYQYMLSPQAFSPNTVMPSFWPNGRSIRQDLAGTPQHQIEAIWQYLLDGRQARAPRGVIREPLEIVVSHKARMLRRSYPNIGKRGIGVGYPGGVNLAFDAEQMRLGLLWKGKFVDPSGVWYGQGHGRVRPMGSTISLPKGPDLDSQNDPWIADDGRPPEHSFRGYKLDDQRRPTFFFTFKSIDVADFFTPMEYGVEDEPGLLRNVQLVAREATGPIRFRLLAEDVVKVEDPGKRFAGKQLDVTILSDQLGAVDNENSTTAMLPLEMQAGETANIRLLYRWK